MSSVFVATFTAVIVITAVTFFRIMVGRTVFDRLLAAGAVGTNAIVLLALMGFIFERPDMFVDLAISYALLNFIGAVAVGKYLEQRNETEGR